MKRLTAFLLQITAVLFFFGCTQEIRIPLEDIDVEFTIPASMDLEPGTTTASFNVTDGKAPEPDDLIILNGPRGQHYCKILSTNESSFTIELYENFANGEHSITVQRGLATKYAGKSSITVEKYDDGVHPAAGSTVYGKVSCDGEAIKGVVVSDGIEVVKTDANGVYQMKSKKKNGYVFISLPSGYTVPLNIVVPQTWMPLSLAESTPERADFELIKTKDQTNFKLLVFGDIHLANRNTDLKQFEYFLDDVDKYRKAHPGELIYGLTLGDMTWDRYWIEKKFSFPEYIKQMKGLTGLPVFQTPGNHDHDGYQNGDFLTIKPFRKNLGPNYFSCNIGEVHLIVLDNIECQNIVPAPGQLATLDYRNGLIAEELAWLKKDLEHVSKDTPLVISMHAQMHANPVETSTPTGWGVKKAMTSPSYEDLLNAVKGFKEVHLFTGHTHVIYHVKKDNIFEHNAGAICATWWWSGKYNPGLSVCTDGAAAGYTIVEFKGKEMKYQYKGIQMDINKQFHAFDRNKIALKASTYVPNASPENLAEWNARVERWKNTSSDNYVYIDVWNWDPGWKVEVREGSTELEVTTLVDYSPLHLIAHSAHRLNGAGKPNFLTNKGCVLHRVKASKANSTLSITVTDRFGNVYTEEMKRPKDFNVATYKAY